MRHLVTMTTCAAVITSLEGGHTQIQLLMTLPENEPFPDRITTL